MCCSSVLYLENDTCHFRHSLWARTSHVALPNWEMGTVGVVQVERQMSTTVPPITEDTCW